MKIKKFNESAYIPSNEDELVSYISSIIRWRVEMQQIRYTDDYEISPDSIVIATKEIVKELKRIGVDFDLIFSAKKYNI